jgi:hypothetical protein
VERAHVSQTPYVVGTTKGELRNFEIALLEGGWSEVREGVEVKAVPGPDGAETFVLCGSRQHQEKEKAMHERFAQRIQKGLEKLKGRLEKARRKIARGPVERQIGRLLGRNSHESPEYAWRDSFWSRPRRYPHKCGRG